MSPLRALSPHTPGPLRALSPHTPGPHISGPRVPGPGFGVGLWWRVLLVGVVCGVVWLVGCGVAWGGAGWWVGSEAVPSSVFVGGEVLLVVHVANVGGSATAKGAGVVVTDTLPAGMEAVQAGEVDAQGVIGSTRWVCKGTVVVTCVNSPVAQPVVGPGDGFFALSTLQSALEAPEIGIRARVGSVPGTGVNVVEVAGGGVPVAAVARQPVRVLAAGVEPVFGIAAVSVSSYAEDGSPAEQAGGHPYDLTFNVQLTSELSPAKNVYAAGDAKTFVARAPAGLVGDPQAVAECPREAFDGVGDDGVAPECPVDSQVGVAVVSLGNQGEPFPGYIPLPVYNLVPPAGVPAQFGFSEFGIYGTMDASLRTGSDYGITETVRNTAQRSLLGTTLTLWGVPADPAHNPERGNVVTPCRRSESCESGLAARPFLSNPDVCGVPMQWQLETDDWLDPEEFLPETLDTTDDLAEPEIVSGCEAQQFAPSLALSADRAGAEEPTGLHVDVHVPQHYENPVAPAEATVKDVSVTLPEGLTVSPSSADGLEACSEAEIGLHTPEAPSCPSGSEIGTVEVTTPLLSTPLRGGVYLAEQEHNPFGSLLAIYITAEGSGTLVKLAGHVQANPQTGQLSTTVTEAPDLPFEDFKLEFFDGPRAPLMTPAACGTYEATGTLAPWSGTTPVNVVSPPFAVTGCPGSFAPQLQAGPELSTAGAFASFTTTLTRQSGEQRLGQFAVTLAPGQLAAIKNVPRCPEPAAATGNCPPESQIGETTVAAGPGPDPYWLKGHIYLTGPYQGAPFGLSILVPAIAGPFNLGNVVVRARIQINPHTAQPTIETDPLPQYVNNTGIPTVQRTVHANITHTGFTLNPTSCGAHTTTATSTSTQGASATSTSTYQTTGCQALAFKPVFKVSTDGQTSKANGASLHVTLAMPPGDANVAKVHVQLPRQLPSRLTTLQLACTEAVFAANPASCPPASLVGHAKATTPLLATPLEGPAYLVSHGGAEFPELVLILQAENITIQLNGETHIHKGITTSTFNTLPDAPVTSFELTLPEGPHSLLTTENPGQTNLCHPTTTTTTHNHHKTQTHTTHQTLQLPTTLTSQNNSVTTQNTTITPQNCPTKHTTTKTKTHPHNKKH